MINFLKKHIIALLVIIGVFSIPFSAKALICYPVNQGGTGVCNITGIIQGNGTAPFSAVTIGSGLSFSGGTLSATGGSSPYSIINTNTIASTGLTGAGTGTIANNAYFSGFNAGLNSGASDFSIFSGYNAGNGAIGSSASVFFGANAGLGAINSVNGIFIGQSAGDTAINNFSALFLGLNAGRDTDGANNTIFLGSGAGDSDTIFNDPASTDWSILIGNNTNTGGFSRSILLGGNITSGVPIANTAADQFMLTDSIVNTRIAGIEYTFPQAGGYSVGDVLTIASITGGVYNLEYQAGGAGTGTVTSVDVGGAGPVSFTGGPITTSGTISMNFTGVSSDVILGDGSTTAISSLAVPTIYNSDGTTTGTRIVSYGSDLTFLDAATSKTGLSFDTTNFYSTLGDFGSGIYVRVDNTNTRTEIGGNLYIPTGAAATYVLTSDASGNASWQPASGGGSSPYSIVNTTSIFSTGLVGTGTGSIAIESFFTGTNAGNAATNADNSNMLGQNAGQNATNALGANFLGLNAGKDATNAAYSNFLGYHAGDGATNASGSNFFGFNAGFGATDAASSFFMGNASGYQATFAASSIFLGDNAGNTATNAANSNFIGGSAGYQATNASQSNFIGVGSGLSATNASNSTFIGTSSGSVATNAANSIFIGTNAGLNDSVDNTANTLGSILIGNDTNTGGFVNSILLGNGVSGIGASNTKDNQFMLADTITDVRWSGVEYTLPSAQASGTQVLQNNGSGVLSWATVSGGTPAGSTTQIQYNNSGSFGASSSFIWDDTAKSLGISSTGKDTWLTATGNVNSFFQANLQNTNSGASASTDFVVTADNGTSTTHYADFGINSSGGGGAPFTTANDAYLYAIDDNLNIGALGSSAKIKFFTTGGTSPVQRMVIDNAGLVGINETTPTSFLQVTRNDIRVTQSDAYGLFLNNGQAATAGVTIQYSPAITFRGSTWLTTAPASATLDYHAFARPVSGSTVAAHGGFVIQQSLNGGAYSDTFEVGQTVFNSNDYQMKLAGNTVFAFGGGVTQLYGGSNGFTFYNSSGSTALATMSNTGVWSFTPGSFTTAATLNTWSLAQTWNNASGVYTGIKMNITNTASAATSRLFDLQTSSTSRFAVDVSGRVLQDGTVTAAGTTGNQTINKPTGTVNIAATGTAVTVTDSVVTANSIINVIARTNDATCSVKNYVPAAGSFVVNMTAACTAETSVGFVVVN